MSYPRTWERTAAGFRLYLITKGRSLDTVTTYVAHLRPFVELCQRYEVQAVKAPRSLAQMYLADQLARVSRSSAHVRLSALKAFFAWCIEERWRKDDPTFGLTVKKERKRQKPPCSEEQVRAIMEACETEAERLMFRVGFACGLRISELIGITAENVDVGQGTILIHGKGNKERWVAPNPEAMAGLVGYIQGRKGRLWPLNRLNARRLLQRVALRAGVSGFYPHKMRSTFATAFLRETNDLVALQQLLGHADISTTARYVEYAAAQRALDMQRRLSG